MTFTFMNVELWKYYVALTSIKSSSILCCLSSVFTDICKYFVTLLAEEYHTVQ